MRLFYDSFVLMQPTLCTLDDFFVICEKFSTAKGKVQIFFIWCRLVSSITSLRHFKTLLVSEKSFAKLLVCSSANAVIYCSRTRVHGSQHSFCGIPTQTTRDTNHQARRQVARSFIREELDSKTKRITPMRKEKVLSVNTGVDDASVVAHDGGADVLLLKTGSTFIATTDSSPRTSYHSSRSQLTAPPSRKTEPGITIDRSDRSSAL